MLVGVCVSGNHANPSGPELRLGHQKQSSSRGDLARAAMPSLSAKRRLDAAVGIDQSPAKRTRLMRLDAAQRPEAEDEQTTILHLKPKPLKASFLKDFVEPAHPGPRSESVKTLVSEWLGSVGSYREKRCRWDTYLHRTDSPISRNLSKSAPDMGRTQDALSLLCSFLTPDNASDFAVPPAPASTGSPSYRAYAGDGGTSYAGSVAPSNSPSASGQSSEKSLVEDPLY
ncbi:hypothetical protein F4810DRAFT_716845 [Camillea tinctor]|nr:hypothetical protein F4810DRAFT_716845 [Camillea tinctor]